jgi:hypothetical protein
LNAGQTRLLGNSHCGDLRWLPRFGVVGARGCEYCDADQAFDCELHVSHLLVKIDACRTPPFIGVREIFSSE